jgi:hypothetical protein
LSRRERFGGVFEKLQGPQFHGECFTKLELNNAGKKTKKKESFFPTFTPTDSTRRVDQQEGLSTDENV